MIPRSVTGPRIWSQCLLLGLCIAVGACSSQGNERPEFRPGRKTYDTNPLDLSNFTQDPEIRQRVLRMPFGEAAARLGSMDFEAETYLDFSRGTESLEQRDRYQATTTQNGDFHVRLQSPTDQVEFYLVGENVFVRQGKGHLRRKLRREVESEAWGDQAFSSLHQTLDLFGPQLQFSNPQSTQAAGRNAIRYDLSLGPAADAEALAEAALKVHEPNLPVGAPARWRELCRPLDVQGHLTVDADTGVVLKAQVQGRLEVADREVRPTQLKISYQGHISRIGEITELEVPKSVPEYKRNKPPHNLLGFFSDHMPPPPEPEDDQGTQTSAR